jgi:hypothetical protein
MDKTDLIGGGGEKASVELSPKFMKSSQSIRMRTMLKFHRNKVYHAVYFNINRY